MILDGRYKITAKLVECTFGKTFRAEDLRRYDHPCVVKQLKLASCPQAQRLFKTEAEILLALGTHDQIPQLLAYFEENGKFYLVQEYIAGHPLINELVPGQPLSEADVMSLLLQLLAVLEAVHSRNVIHRDIKPDNIIRRDADGKLILIDFGAVKILSSQSNPALTIAIGTTGYMPNEQISGKPTLSSDVYAVGMVGIQAITGIFPTSLPKDRDTSEVVWRDRARVSPKLAEVLEKMVRYDYRQRYPSAKEALAAVRALPTPPVTLPVTLPVTPPVTPPVTVPSPPPGSKLLIGAICVVGVVAGVLISTVIGPLWKDKVIYPPKLEMNGEAIAGALDGNDKIKPLNNSYSDTYVFTGSSGEEVTIEVNSKDFDTKLEVLDSDNNSLTVSMVRILILRLCSSCPKLGSIL
ncbi:MAG: protein kinase [Hormoscilla sp. GM7CHS1pb]|nr:protein kinase [Hormoscilla sp. GM7CHS1pb]